MRKYFVVIRMGLLLLWGSDFSSCVAGESDVEIQDSVRGKGTNLLDINRNIVFLAFYQSWGPLNNCVGHIIWKICMFTFSFAGKNVYIVQSSGRDTNNHLMDLILFIQVIGQNIKLQIDRPYCKQTNKKESTLCIKAFFCELMGLFSGLQTCRSSPDHSSSASVALRKVNSIYEGTPVWRSAFCLSQKKLSITILPIIVNLLLSWDLDFLTL